MELQTNLVGRTLTDGRTITAVYLSGDLFPVQLLLLESPDGKLDWGPALEATLAPR